MFSFYIGVSIVVLIKSNIVNTSGLQVTAEQHTLAKYFVELTMVDYDMIHFPPSQVASAAFSLMQKVFDCGDWVIVFLFIKDHIVPVDCWFDHF